MRLGPFLLRPNQEQIKNTQWCYYITDSYSPNKVPKDEAKGHVLPNKGKIIEVKLNDLDLKYTPDKTIYFFNAQTIIFR